MTTEYASHCLNLRRWPCRLLQISNIQTLWKARIEGGCRGHEARYLQKFVTQLREDVGQEDFESAIADVLHEGGTLHHVIQVPHSTLVHLCWDTGHQFLSQPAVQQLML